MTLYTLLVIVHIVGTAIGVGGATFSDWLFHRTIRDRWIDHGELQLLYAAGRFVLLGLAVLVVSGIGLVWLALYGPDAMGVPDKLWAKLVVVSVIILNGLFLHVRVMPWLSVHSKAGIPFVPTELGRYFDVIVVSGTISFVSWYTALILGGWRGLAATVSEILVVYFAALAIAVTIALPLGRWYGNRKGKN